MQVKKRIINGWVSLKEKGDVNKLAKLIGKDPSTVSRILAGKQETTSDVVAKIVEFYGERKKLIKKLQAA